MPPSNGKSAASFPTVAIIGSGFAGLGMAIQLKKAGFNSFTIFEKASRVGGTWRDNTYPGAACDVPSHLYSFSFEPKTNWSRAFPEQPEILEYIEHCVDKYGLRPHIHFDTEIENARFEESRGLWRIRTTKGGEFNAHVLVSGCGQLNRPAFPNIPGLKDFAGVQFHSARWNHDYDLTGKNVAVIGTGASAIQFIPQIAPKVKKLHVFQRTPPWIIEKPDRPYLGIEKFLFRKVPAIRETYRQFIYWMLESRFFAFSEGSRIAKTVKKEAREYLRNSIEDPSLRKALTPDYELGCKRILISNDYYPCFNRSNVELITTGIERIEKNGVRTQDGTLREADTIIFGTGFQSTDFLAPMKITGRNSLDLNEAWRDGAEAYFGITVSGFPNLFLLYGPNTNLGHNSIIFMLECQIRYTMECIKKLAQERLAYLDPMPGEMRRYNDRLQARHADLVWNSGCTSWYKNESGKNTNNWPGFTVEYWLKTRKVDFSAYRMEPRTG
ncbi:MAG: NAD(P)/FAD-dependent oxidoreductase [Bdellovibrionota bacterium]